MIGPSKSAVPAKSEKKKDSKNKKGGMEPSQGFMQRMMGKLKGK
jgi:hypothetical protein